MRIWNANFSFSFSSALCLEKAQRRFAKGIELCKENYVETLISLTLVDRTQLLPLSLARAMSIPLSFWILFLNLLIKLKIIRIILIKCSFLAYHFRTLLPSLIFSFSRFERIFIVVVKNDCNQLCMTLLDCVNIYRSHPHKILFLFFNQHISSTLMHIFTYF